MTVQANSLGYHYALYYVVQGGRELTPWGALLIGVLNLGFIQKNYNPYNKHVDDCVIRAIATVTGRDWNDIYLDLVVEGYKEKDMPNGNIIWGEYLLSHGFTRHVPPNTCPLCYTVRQFAKDHKYGKYILGDGTHAVAVVDGGYYIDTFDSGDRTVLFYYRKDDD